MPVSNKLPALVLGNKASAAAAGLDDHASEAAKVKRTREHAYFNSYDFDAIEVLPYDDDDEDEDEHDAIHIDIDEAATNRKPPNKSSQSASSVNAKYLQRSSLTHAPASPSSQRRRLQNASLSSKSVSSGSAPSSSSQDSVSGSGNYAQPHRSELKYAYLQRLGAFFVGSSHQSAEAVSPTLPPERTASAVSSSQSAADVVRGDELILGVRNTDAMVKRMEAAADSGNFLLPRAMLKYQSVGSSNNNNNSSNGSANSMPLAVISASHTGTGKLLQNGNSSVNHNNSNNNSSNNNKHSSSNKSLMMTSNTTDTLLLHPSGKTRLGYVNTGNDANTGFHLTSNKSAVAAATTNTTSTTTTAAALAATATTTATLVRNKKLSTSSTITTTTTASIVSVELEDVDNDNNDDDDDDLATQATFAVAAADNIGNRDTMLVKAKITASSAAAAITTDSEKRGRANSHQSHYSTDKSGSSGYYSSNVCSTYSIEDHIYCEPVIDILDLSSNSKSVVGAGVGGAGVVSNNNNNISTMASHSSRHSKQTTNVVAAAAAAALVVSQVETSEMQSNSRTRDMNGVGQSKRYGRVSEDEDDAAAEDDDEDATTMAATAAAAAAAVTHSGKSMTMVSLRRHSGRNQRNKSSLLPQQQPQHFSENLRILETSIENLDRHLKNFPSLSSQERIASFVQSTHQHHNHSHLHHHHHNNTTTYLPPLPQHADVVVVSGGGGGEKQRAHNNHLPTIMEGYDPSNQPRPWQDEIADDSLLDIDLDSFLLVNETKGAAASKHTKSKQTSAKEHPSSGGIDNPSFLTDELEENNYKCAKYINSCPEDAYRVESDIVATASEKSATVDHFQKRYEDQLHFQNTRELLEDVREKIRLLSRSRNEFRAGVNNHESQQRALTPSEEEMPKELEGMITTLKRELESYLARMNQHSELEIRQLCSGLVKNHNIVKMKKAFERRRSNATSISAIDSDYDFSAYEALRDGGGGGGAAGVVVMSAAGILPFSIRQQQQEQQQHITSIRCASDPNFKMKRKSLTEVFPVAECYIESVNENIRPPAAPQTRRGDIASVIPPTQLQRNLSFHKPILNQLDAQVVGPNGMAPNGGSAGLSGGSGAESGESGDKDSILEWHRKKPSIWEMYYGTNRLNQSLLGKRNGMVVNSNQASMSYPSSRPESDFTLDLPRAEQLRIKMEKEKKFRQRCRYITTFLSLVFFLLTVMVVSLVLTRGKRMFGSMI